MNNDVDLTENGDFVDRPLIKISANGRVPWRKPLELDSYKVSYTGDQWSMVAPDTFMVTFRSNRDAWEWEQPPDSTSINPSAFTTFSFTVVNTEDDLSVKTSVRYNSSNGNITISTNDGRNALDKRRPLNRHRIRKCHTFDSIVTHCYECNAIVYGRANNYRCNECKRKEALREETRNFMKQLHALDFYARNRYRDVKLIDRYGYGRWTGSNGWYTPLTKYKSKAVRYKGQNYRGRGYAWQPKGRVAQDYDDLFDRLDWRELLAKEI